MHYLRILDEKSNEVVPHAKLSMDLFYPSGHFERLVEDIANENGQFLYQWTADKGCETGEYTLTLRVSINGYEAKTESLKFKVTYIIQNLY